MPMIECPAPYDSFWLCEGLLCCAMLMCLSVLVIACGVRCVCFALVVACCQFHTHCCRYGVQPKLEDFTLDKVVMERMTTKLITGDEVAVSSALLG